MRQIFTLAVIAAAIASPALASPDAPMAADIMHLAPGHDWRAYWACAKRVTREMTNKDLAAQTAVSHVEAECANEKAVYLLAQIDAVPRDERIRRVSLVEFACAGEAMADIVTLEVYWSQSGEASGAPTDWGDPTSDLNH